MHRNTGHTTGFNSNRLSYIAVEMDLPFLLTIVISLTDPRLLTNANCGIYKYSIAVGHTKSLAVRLLTVCEASKAWCIQNVGFSSDATRQTGRSQRFQASAVGRQQTHLCLKLLVRIVNFLPCYLAPGIQHANSQKFLRFF